MQKNHILLTPGPLTTSVEVKQSLLKDWGSRDSVFIDMTMSLRKNILKIVRAPESFTCIPIQGSGTFGLEAAFTTFTNKNSKILVLSNGAYGKRASSILKLLGHPFVELQFDEKTIIEPNVVQQFILKDPDLTHIFMVHCETTTGVLNPLAQISKISNEAKLCFLVDAMSTFGGIPIDLLNLNIDVIIASSNKCLEGIPGISFILAKQDLVESSRGNSKSLSLDLSAQWLEFEKSGQWRFTPPTHVVAGLLTALDGLNKEGGVAGRFARYRDNCNQLVQGMRELGFKTLLSDSTQAPVIVTFYDEFKNSYTFNNFYNDLQEYGFTIYPGKLTSAQTFRVGCIGNVYPKDIQRFISAVENIIQ
tara:strand:- start:6158 stop:7243 length:1086 start_codon:yes stop_codon:yes gene_type:complete